MGIDHHNTGAMPGKANEYTLNIANESGTLIARYFLYDCPVDLIPDNRPDDNWESAGLRFQLIRLTPPPLIEESEPT